MSNEGTSLARLRSHVRRCVTHVDPCIHLSELCQAMEKKWITRDPHGVAPSTRTLYGEEKAWIMPRVLGTGEGQLKDLGLFLR